MNAHDVAIKRNESVERWLLAALDGVVVGINARYDGGVGLVVDELGSSPLVLRSLCALYNQDFRAKVATTLKASSFTMIACGTGCDNLMTLPGSSPTTYHIERLEAVHGKAFLKTCAENFPVDLKEAVLHPKTSSAKSAALLLENPRIAALFSEELRRLRTYRGRAAGPGHEKLTLGNGETVIASLLTTALLRYKSLNGMKDLQIVDAMATAGRALKVCMGGPEQLLTPQDVRELMCNLGLVEDLARRVKSVAADEVILQPATVNVDALVLQKKCAHRFVMAPAMVEMVLRGFGVAERPRSGPGFEDTMCDFAVLQLIAGVPTPRSELRLAKNDPLAEVKELLQSGACGAKAIFTICLTCAARSIENALIHVVSFAGEHLPGTGAMKVVAVVKNGDKAPAADIFVLSADLSRSTIKEPWTGELGNLRMPLQCKHYESTSLTDYAVASELYKMGFRSWEDIAGRVATSIKLPSSPELTPQVTVPSTPQPGVLPGASAPQVAVPIGPKHLARCIHAALKLKPEEVLPAAFTPQVMASLQALMPTKGDIPHAEIFACLTDCKLLPNHSRPRCRDAVRDCNVRQRQPGEAPQRGVPATRHRGGRRAAVARQARSVPLWAGGPRAMLHPRVALVDHLVWGMRHHTHSK